MRASGVNSATPAIAYSGFGGPEEVARSKAAGFDVHITKPVDLEQMVEAIDSLRRRTAGKAAEAGGDGEARG